MRKPIVRELFSAISMIIVGMAIGALTGIIMSGGSRTAAQEQTAKNTTTPTATPAPVIETGKDKPIIVTKAQIIQSDSLAKDLKIAQLEAEAAIPPQLKARIDAAQKAIDEYYIKEIGIARDKLSEYEISNGVDGALILRKKTVAVAPEKK